MIMVHQVETVVSGEDASMSEAPGLAINNPIVLFPDTKDMGPRHGKHYPIFQVPIPEEGFSEEYCFKLVGRDMTFCITKDCNMKHNRGGAVMAVNAGNVFVSKKPTCSAFIEPKIDGHLTHQSVINEWKRKLLPSKSGPQSLSS
jgi:hypothetical protein